MTLTLSPQTEISYRSVRLFIKIFQYTSKNPDSLQSKFLSKVTSTSLTNEEQNLCEGPLTQKECFEALKKMSLTKRQVWMDSLRNSTKFSRKTFLFFLISALNYAFDSGYLSVTQRRGVIKLIPKKMRNYTSSKIGGLLLF